MARGDTFQGTSRAQERGFTPRRLNLGTAVGSISSKAVPLTTAPEESTATSTFSSRQPVGGRLSDQLGRKRRRRPAW